MTAPANPYAGAPPVAIPISPRHPLAGMSADEVAPYEDSPVGNEAVQKAALARAAVRASASFVDVKPEKRKDGYTNFVTVFVARAPWIPDEDPCEGTTFEDALQAALDRRPEADSPPQSPGVVEPRPRTVRQELGLDP